MKGKGSRAGKVPRDRAMNTKPQASAARSRKHTLDASDVKGLGQAREELRIADEELRKQNEELSTARTAFEVERHRYQEIFDLAPEAYLVTDLAGIVREANAAAAELVRVPQGHLIGGPIADYVAQEDRHHFRRRLKGLDRAVAVQTWESGLVRPGGDQFDGEITATPVMGLDGQGVALRWVLRDISERKQAEKRIRALNAELEQRVQQWTAELDVSNRLRSDLALRLTTEGEILQAIMDNTHAQLAYLDPDFNFILVNAAYAKGSGHTKEELIGHNHFDLFPNAENQAIFEQVRDRGETMDFLAKPFIYADQPERGVTYWNWSCVPVKNASGHIQGLVLSLLEVTDTIRAQDAERDHARKTAAILESITEGYITLDRSWHFTEVNPAAERTILRRSKQELLGRVIWEQYPRSVGGELWHQCMIAMAEQRPVHFEAELSLDGKWHEVHAYPSRDGLSIYLRDIEERKREQEANARLAAIVESSEDAIISIDAQGTISSWNPGAEHLFGYSSQEIIGQPLSTLYPPDHKDEFPQIMRRLLNGERIDHYETHRIRKDGRQLDVSLSISPIRDAKGNVVGAAKIARDISAQKRAREAEHFLSEASAVLSSSLDYESTLQSVAHFAVPFLADYCVIDVMQREGALQRVTIAAGTPEREKLLRDLMARYPPGSEAMGGQVLQSGLPRTMWEMADEPLAQAGNDPDLGRLLRELEPRSFMIFPMIARGRTVGVISLGLAEASRRYDQETLAAAEDLARRAAYAVDNARLYYESQAALSARDQFLSSASHEVRTPLTVIQGYTQLLLQDVEGAQAEITAASDHEDGKLLRGLKNIEYSAGRLATLMSDLLDVTRLPTNGITLSRERLNLSELLMSVVDSVRAQKELLRRSSSMELRVQLPEDEVSGEWDRVRLEQVLTNLVDNAVKYSPAVGIIQIRLDVEEGDRQSGARCAHLVICDQGIGIPKGDLSKIFQPFTRAANAVERNYPGLGIGLAVSRAIINEHGGCMWGESEGLDQGSCFHVVLPLTGTDRRTHPSRVSTEEHERVRREASGD